MRLAFVPTMLLLAATVLATAGPASAGVVVSPLKQEVAVKPGQAVTFRIGLAYTARNPDDQPEKVRLEVSDFRVNEDGQIVFEPIGTVADSASRWVTLDKAELTLKPGESAQVLGTIAVPASASGEFYSAVLVSLGESKPARPGVGINYRIASGLFVTVPGAPLVRRAQVASAELIWPEPTPADGAPATQPDARIDDPARLPWPQVVARLQNVGRARFDATGRLRISDNNGRVVFDGPLVSRRATVQAGDIRLFRCPLTRALPAGRYVARLDFEYQANYGRASHQMPLTLDAQQSADLAVLVERARRLSTRTLPGVALAASPDKLALAVPAGALRAVKVDLRNVGEASADCTAKVLAIPDVPTSAGWITLTAAQFSLKPKQSDTLGLIVRVPPEAAGLHKATLLIEATSDDARKFRMELPIELAVGSGS